MNTIFEVVILRRNRIKNIIVTIINMLFRNKQTATNLIHSINGVVFFKFVVKTAIENKLQVG